MRVAAIVPAFNEEKVIESCLMALQNQSMRIDSIIVIDDGSEDRTGEIARQYTDHVLRLVTEKENRLGGISLAEVYNEGFQFLRDQIDRIDYILVCDADTVLPPNYVKDLIQFMEENQISLSSGIIQAEDNIKNVRGSGRIISQELFKLMDFGYPVNYGFDSYPAHIAIHNNLKFAVHKDLYFRVLRPTSTNYTESTFMVLGKGYRAYGYLFIFAVRSFLTLSINLRSLKPIIFGITGYMTLKSKYKYPKELRKSVSARQQVRLVEKIRNLGQKLLNL